MIEATAPERSSRRGMAIIDSCTAIRVGLPMLVSEVECLGTFTGVESFLELGLRPAIVVVDPGTCAFESRPGGPINVVVELAAAGHRVCVFTDEQRPNVLVRYLRSGARGIVLKRDPDAIVRDIVLGVANGSFQITPSMARVLTPADARLTLPLLTSRQEQVLAARARGDRWAAIAHSLYITENVAREHMAAVTRKFTPFFPHPTPGVLAHALGLCDGDVLAS